MKRKQFKAGFPGRLEPIPVGGIAFVPEPLPPLLEIPADLLKLNEAALLALGELRAIVPTLPNPSLITQPFLRREAVLSSRIEGTQTHLEQLYLFEAEVSGQEARRLTPEEADAQEVLNYVLALEYGLAQLERLPICERLLKDIHARLLQGVRGQEKSPGQYRSVQNFIGRGHQIRDARFVPPPVEFMQKAMRGLEIYINQPSDNFPTLVQLALVHYQFETIHPFADGNGRVGRLLISLMLAERQILPQPLLYLSAYFERNRDDYIEHLWQVSSKGAWIAWLQYFLQGVRDEAADASLRARRLLALREQFRSQSGRRDSANLLTLLDSLFDFPVITIPAAQRRLDVSYNGAKKLVERMLEMGIVAPVESARKSKVFVARPILQILDA